VRSTWIFSEASLAYLRVSTEKQADKGVSLEAQRARVQAYAALYDVTLVEVIVDAAVSAKTLGEAWTREGVGHDPKRQG
jgi:DNA invertase Pin-like site-specific DNA recombinase